MISIDISPDSFANVAQLSGLARRFGLTVKEVATHQSALAAKDLTVRMPPFKSGGVGAAMKISEPAGKGAIRHDLSTITSSPGSGQSQAKLIHSGTTNQWLIKMPSGAVAIIPPERIDLDGQRLGLWHQNRRSTNTGRTPRRWNKENALVVKKAEVAHYAKKVFDHIGSLAAGWLPAWRYFSSRDRIIEGQSGILAQPPAFIARHSPGTGSVTDAMMKEGGGYLEGRMHYRYGNLGKLQGILDWVMLRRSKDMGGQMQKRLSKHVMDFNTGMVRYAG